MAQILDINGIVRDYGFVPQDGVSVSFYQKVGETITDSNGVFQNVTLNPDSTSLIAKFEKDGFFEVFRECLYNGVVNASLMKADASPPDLPSLFRAVDFNTGDAIMLSWTESSFEYVAGYNVYRTGDIAEKFERINSELIVDLSYLDTGLSADCDYYYILEIVSANSVSYRQGTPSRTAIIGPVRVVPILSEIDITLDAKLKIDSTKTNKEGEKIFDGNLKTYWESCRGDGAWIEFDFSQERYISRFYFRKMSKSRGVTFATLERFDGSKWVKIQDANFIQDIDYTFRDFIVKTNKIRLYVVKTEPLTEAEIVEARIFGL